MIKNIDEGLEIYKKSLRAYFKRTKSVEKKFGVFFYDYGQGSIEHFRIMKGDEELHAFEKILRLTKKEKQKIIEEIES